MKHVWEVDPGKNSWEADFLICRTCGCFGGCIFKDDWGRKKEHKRKPYLAGAPLAELPDDCDEAKGIIDAFIEKYPIWKEYVDKYRRAGQENRTPISGAEAQGTANIPDPQ